TQGLDFQVSPVALNMGERHFVKDLQSAWNAGVFNGYELFMLRNQTGQGAVGVFIDGGFQPDFILWLKGTSKEHIVFVDPKGLRHHTPNSPKVQFHKTVKELQKKLAEQDARNAHIRMDAFLISNTPKATLMGEWTDSQGNPVTDQQLDDWNILFEQDGPDAVKKLVQKVTA